MKLVLFWNPLFHLWEQGIATLQEFACDEALVDLKNVSPHAYGGCLLKAASLSLSAHRLPAGTAGMAVGSSGLILKRRIDMMFDQKSRSRKNRWMAVLAGTVALGILATVTYASQGLIGDRRITLTDAQQMAKAASRDSHFPIVVNADVVDQLNRLLGTPDGREFVRSSLEKMKNYRPTIEAKLQNYALPDELLAVPFIESGFDNVKRTRAAGLWMFIASTARHFNLRVDDTQDDRLNIEAETDAAMRYLGANYLRFQDWQLAVLAYNSGESQVQRGIDSTGSRDAWTLIHAGFDGDPGYLAKLMAVVLILKNPSVLN
jgi:membrane-bound lytic murein transglycosylase D